MEWQVLGHEWAANLLQQHVQQGQVRHAYLFCGPPGVGRRTLALRFAQALNCSNPPAPGLFCGECRACRQTWAMQHPDFSLVQAEREGGELKIEAIRTLQQTLSLTPYEAQRRVALILRFHEANSSAQNALLKTLEEAPPSVVLLLTADAPELVLPTIASRCELLRLRPLPIQQTATALRTLAEMDAPTAQLLAQISGGRLGLALRFWQDQAQMQARSVALQTLWDLLHSSLAQRFAYAAACTRERPREDRGAVRQDLRSLFTFWAGFWRDVLLRSQGAHAPLTNPDWQEPVEQLAQYLPPMVALQQLKALEKALARLPSANLQLLTEVILLDLPRL
jgi:DNA polymerase-3 subunit delta'